MIPLEKVKDILDKHAKLEVDLSSAEIDKKKFAEMSKEYSDLNEIIDDAKFYISFDFEIFQSLRISNSFPRIITGIFFFDAIHAIGVH